LRLAHGCSGRGLYFAKNASKSHDYGARTERTVGHERHRVMFLCKVALGQPLRTPAERLDERQIDAEMAARGCGGQYDSLVGLDHASGGVLNYEEAVIYEEAAAIPSYLIVYKL
jgi:hypothetical protein